MTRRPDDPVSDSRAEVESAPTLDHDSAHTWSLAAPIPPAFEHGDLVAGRYRIVRFLAAGGMGEVFEAEDTELAIRVALKTVREPLSGSTVAIERFKREINLARRVTHPNVCRLFDVGFHERRPGDRGERVTFLTMEFLSGETLSERLRRAGRLSAADALPIIEQMAAALDAAHRSHVVHRDFKSENVVLVPAPERPYGVRAVVTDFGLARTASVVDAPATLTQTGGLLGTPGYMAPEQVEGGQVTASADLYALGVVIYEMVTGELPFTGPNSMAIAVQRLKRPAPPPRRLVPDLDPTWEAAILRCLEREPARRFTSAGEVVRALASPQAASLAGRWGARVWMGLAALGILLVAAGLGLGLYAWRLHARALSAARARRSVAVLGFSNASGAAETSWLGGALAELLATELGAGDKLRTIPEENVARVKLELGLGSPGELDRAELSRIRQMLPVDDVVVGSYQAGGGTLRLEVRVQDAVRGDTVATLSEQALQSDLLPLVTRVGARLRDRLGAGSLSTEEARALRASLPKNPEAARLYTQGLARIRRHEATAARDLLEQAALIDPGNARIHAALAGVWQRIGDDAKTSSEAKRALDLAQSLPRVERMEIEAQYHEAVRDWAGAVEIYRTLSSALPDDIDLAGDLARAQIKAGQSKQALLTLEAIRRRPVPPSQQLRVDLLEAKVAEAVTDVRRQQAAAARAVVGATATGARLIAADAHLLEGNAQSELGDKVKARASYEQAKRIYIESGHRIGLAQVSLNLAGLEYEAGNLALARQGFEDALAIERELGEREEVARALNNLALVTQDMGDIVGALRRHQEALAIRREIGDQKGLASSLANIGLIEEMQGDLPAARAKLEESLAIVRELHQKVVVGQRLEELGGLLIDQGDLVGARARLEESLAVRAQVGAPVPMAGSRALLAMLNTAEGHHEQAVALAREAARALEAEHAPEGVALAQAILAQALLGQGQTAQALAAAELAAKVGADVQAPESRMAIAIALGRARAARGAAGEAIRGLQVASDQASQLGLEGLRLQAELALGECELKAGRRAAGRERLAALKRAAEQRGFGRLVRQAKTLLRE